MRTALALGLSYIGLPLALGGLVWNAPPPEPPPQQRKVDFAREILPIFKASCFPCHGPERRQGGLRLSNREEAFKGGISGRVIIPGDAENSLLVKRISSDEEGPRMPKGMTALSPEQIALIKRWINEGAEWPEGAENAVHWAFVPPKRPPVPEVKNKAWVRNPIDAFILHRLEREGLSPSPEAPKETLIRRLYLDLIGLPPSPEEVDAFLKDRRPDAYERLVDKLLSSPHYGERQAIVWLDLARYADTDGFEKDLRRTMWRYRDWVIDAFNRDMPFDQFTIEQIAGDLLPNPTLAQRIATGFHRNTMQNLEGGVDQAEAHENKLYDRVDTTATVWLGITMNCARCHDHKYDPFTQKEYYQLLAFFNNAKIYPVGDARVSEEKWLEAQIPAPTPEQERQLAALERQIKQLESRGVHEPPTLTPLAASAENGTELKSLDDGSVLAGGATPDTEVYRVRLRLPQGETRAILLEALPHESLPYKGPGRAGNGNFVLTGVRLTVNGRPVAFREARATAVQSGFDPRGVLQPDNAETGWALDGHLGKAQTLELWLQQPLRGATEAELTLECRYTKHKKHVLGRFRIRALNGETARLWTLRRQRDALKSQIPTTLVMEDNPTDKPLTAIVRPRGEFTRQGDTVETGTPAVLHPFPKDAPRNRLGLALWLASKENPLTARVQVNRMWATIFGRGIVETLENFGTQGAYPTHPDLLDWLAVEFMERGWSMKHLYRLIVTSSTYRQSSRVTPELLARDPKNELYARAPRYRLPAELVRDNALAISGLLSRKIGGPSVFPPQPEGVWDIPYNADRWTTDTGENRYRRGLYTFWRRTAPYPSMVAFDAHSREVCVAMRPRTNTPLQSLVLLNDPAYMEAAVALAQRMAQKGKGNLRASLRYGFRSCTAREPTPAELQRLEQLYQQMCERYARQSEAAKQLTGEPNAERAALTLVANALLNLDETITRE
ncbi:MAG: PSD1 and planctomycete cytochrome C domain-containing protein [Fimbriimonadales bacterium]|nr:PSD1 and planctomycete cytochrome C domain-containing protein [Fimbriimonadales bacterium]